MAKYMRSFNKTPKNCKKCPLLSLICPIFPYLFSLCNFYVQFLSNLINSNVSRPKLRSFIKIDFSIWWCTCYCILLRVVVSKSPYVNETGRFEGYHGNQNNYQGKLIPFQYQHAQSAVSKKHIWCEFGELCFGAEGRIAGVNFSWHQNFEAKKKC